MSSSAKTCLLSSLNTVAKRSEAEALGASVLCLRHTSEYTKDAYGYVQHECILLFKAFCIYAIWFAFVLISLGNDYIIRMVGTTDICWFIVL